MNLRLSGHVVFAGLLCQACTEKAVDRPAVVKFAPLSICSMSKDATGLIHGVVTAIGAAQDIPAQGGVMGTRSTPISVGVSEVVSGAGPSSGTVWLYGDVDADGNSEFGPLKSNGKFVTAYFFIVEFGGKSHVYGGSGFFWTEGGVVRNSSTYQSGVADSDFRAEVARSKTGACVSNTGLPLPSQGVDAGVTDGGSG